MPRLCPLHFWLARGSAGALAEPPWRVLNITIIRTLLPVVLEFACYNETVYCRNARQKFRQIPIFTSCDPDIQQAFTGKGKIWRDVVCIGLLHKKGKQKLTLKHLSGVVVYKYSSSVYMWYDTTWYDRRIENIPHAQKGLRFSSLSHISKTIILKNRKCRKQWTQEVICLWKFPSLDKNNQKITAL